MRDTAGQKTHVRLATECVHRERGSKFVETVQQNISYWSKCQTL